MSDPANTLPNHNGDRLSASVERIATVTAKFREDLQQLDNVLAANGGVWTDDMKRSWIELKGRQEAVVPRTLADEREHMERTTRSGIDSRTAADCSSNVKQAMDEVRDPGDLFTRVPEAVSSIKRTMAQLSQDGRLMPGTGRTDMLLLCAPDIFSTLGEVSRIVPPQAENDYIGDTAWDLVRAFGADETSSGVVTEFMLTAL